MSRKDVYAALSKSGIPCALVAWKKDEAPPLPWCVYVEGDTNALYADDSLYGRIVEYSVELYQRTADLAVEKKLEEAISGIGPLRKGEQVWVSSDECLMTPYYFTYVERI